MGSLFLLISLVFFSDITTVLDNLQGEMTFATPGFWNMQTVLTIVRIIFIATGSFLTVFGVAFFWIKKRQITGK